MSKKFDEIYLRIIKEASGPPPKGGKPGEENNSQQQKPDIGGGPSDKAPPGEGGDGVDLDPNSMGGDEEQNEMEGMEDQEEPVFPEELELAKLAVRAMQFNIQSKDVHQFSLRVGDISVPFEKISDYFEETKNWKPVLSFIEWLMNKYEGISSKWAESESIKGKGIIDKLKQIRQENPEEKLDDSQIAYWTRLVLNCLLNGSVSENLTIHDVNEDSIREIFNLLKQHEGTDTRGLMPNIDMHGVGT